MKTLLTMTLAVVIFTLGGCGEDAADSNVTHPAIHVGDDHNEKEHHKEESHDHAQEGHTDHDGEDHEGHEDTPVSRLGRIELIELGVTLLERSGDQLWLSSPI